MAILAKSSGLMVAVRILEDTSNHWCVHALDEKRPKYIKKSDSKCRVFGDNAALEEVEAWIEKKRKPKVSVLTNAQIYTLRRLASGTEYRAQGNGKRGYEWRKAGRYTNDPINAPSIPPLIRRGLVQIDPRYHKINPSSYYPVVLTEEGANMAKTAVIHD